MELQDFTREMLKEAGLIDKAYGIGRKVVRTLSGARAASMAKNVQRVGGKKGAKPLSKIVGKLGKKKAGVALDTAKSALTAAKAKQKLYRVGAGAGAAGVGAGYMASK